MQRQRGKNLRQEQGIRKPATEKEITNGQGRKEGRKEGKLERHESTKEAGSTKEDENGKRGGNPEDRAGKQAKTTMFGYYFGKQTSAVLFILRNRMIGLFACIPSYAFETPSEVTEFHTGTETPVPIVA